MFDRFLDQDAEAKLRRGLDRIMCAAPELLRIARREVSPPGGRAARRPNVPESTPPLRLGALSLTEEARAVLASWAVNLADDTGLKPSPGLGAAGLASFLSRHVDRIVKCPWAPDCAAEVDRLARQLGGAADPTTPAVTEYAPETIALGMAHAAAPVEDLVFLVEASGRGKVKATRIRQWAARGKLDEVDRRKGRPWYRLDDVLFLLDEHERKSSA